MYRFCTLSCYKKICAILRATLSFSEELRNIVAGGACLVRNPIVRGLFFELFSLNTQNIVNLNIIFLTTNLETLLELELTH